jgi:hypothetical protein
VHRRRHAADEPGFGRRRGGDDRRRRPPVAVVSDRRAVRCRSDRSPTVVLVPGAAISDHRDAGMRIGDSCREARGASRGNAGRFERSRAYSLSSRFGLPGNRSHRNPQACWSGPGACVLHLAQPGELGNCTQNPNIVFGFAWRAAARWYSPGPPGLAPACYTLRNRVNSGTARKTRTSCSVLLGGPLPAGTHPALPAWRLRATPCATG